MNKITILIADDHKLIRETWTVILNSDPRFQVIAACGNAEEAVELAGTENSECDPDGYQYVAFIRIGSDAGDPENSSFGESYWRIDALSTSLCQKNAADGSTWLCNQELLQRRNDHRHPGSEPR